MAGASSWWTPEFGWRWRRRHEPAAVGHDVDSPGFGEGAGVERHSGQRGSAGAPLGTVPGGLVRLAIRGGKPSDEGRPLTVFGVAAPLAPGTTDITDGELLQRIAATEGYQGKSAEERAAGVTQLTLNKAIQTLRVPVGSVFGINGDLRHASPPARSTIPMLYRCASSPVNSVRRWCSRRVVEERASIACWFTRLGTLRCS